MKINNEIIAGRYITNNHLEMVLDKLDKSIFKIEIAGKSVQEKNIYKLQFGTGNFKVLLWSQMHGNESTTTKAVFDFLIDISNGLYKEFLNNFSFIFIPILNPDGASAYTRVNANAIDLNRDSKDLTQPESKLLRDIFDAFKPDLALNMHDQRTIFSVGDSDSPATLSFLAPAFNDDRDINEVRTYAMQLIAYMAQELAGEIPGQVGRFDDSFNINCIGDMFTYLNVPTILFEAGHYQNDYNREFTREMVYNSLKQLFKTIINKDYEKFSVADYLAIPENEKRLVDILITNFKGNNEFAKKTAIPVIYKEVVNNGIISFLPSVDFDSAPNFKYGHITLDFNGLEINSEKELVMMLNEIH